MSDMDIGNKNLLNALSSLIALQIVAVAVLAGFFWMTHRDLQGVNEGLAQMRQALSRQGQVARIDNWAEHVHPYNAALGPVDAEVVITAYSDFQCPFCKTFALSTHKQLVAEFNGKVRMVFKHLPLEAIHPEAMISAIAAQCANRVGSFWELHDLLFEQDSLNADTVLSLGEDLGLGENYASCVRNEETQAEVEQDLEDARNAGVGGTPTFVINGEVLQGAPAFAAFKDIIDSQLTKVRQAGI